MQKRDLSKVKKIRDELEIFADSERKKFKNCNGTREQSMKFNKIASLFECAVEDLDCVFSVMEQG